MQAEDFFTLKVRDVENGTNIGSVTGILIDGHKKQVAALEVGGNLLSPPDYLPFQHILAIENDVLTISSSAALTVRGEYNTLGLVGHLRGCHVFTEDGKELGVVHEYDIDVKDGEITAITVAIDTDVMGGLWHTVGERFEIPRSLIATLGDAYSSTIHCLPLPMP